MASKAKNIIVALDYHNQNHALELVDKLDPEKCRLKVGKEMFTLFGPNFVRNLQQKGFDIFLDLKFHDIPNTVAKAVTSAADLGVWMVNVHASGGRKMMEAASHALEQFGSDKPDLIAVTVLTSMHESELSELGISGSLNDHVLRLATLAKSSGLDGVVCSAKEAKMLKSALSSDFKLVTPGIRPSFAAKGDQTRIMTPSDAIAAGVDYMVIGRPITQADDPMVALKLIEQELSS